jgi:hypothetical protein
MAGRVEYRPTCTSAACGEELMQGPINATPMVATSARIILVVGIFMMKPVSDSPIRKPVFVEALSLCFASGL